MLQSDFNRNGIPDEFDFLFRVLGWVGRLTGDKQFQQRIEQQLRQQIGKAQTTTAQAPGREITRERTSTARKRAPAQPVHSVVDRRRDPSNESRLNEFLRKLAIVTGVVLSGYYALKALGLA